MNPGVEQSVEEAGNGKHPSPVHSKLLTVEGRHQFSGSFHGHGSMLLIFSGKYEVSMMCTAGACRLSCVLLQGKSHVLEHGQALTASRMPGSPMWLMALYVGGMKNVSTYFVPPLW